jgi:hypothetical protein
MPRNLAPGFPIMNTPDQPPSVPDPGCYPDLEVQCGPPPVPPLERPMRASVGERHLHPVARPSERAQAQIDAGRWLDEGAASERRPVTR